MAFMFHDSANPILEAAAAGSDEKLAELLKTPGLVHKITQDRSQSSEKPPGLPASRPLTAAIMHGHVACMIMMAKATPSDANPIIPTAPDYWGRPPLLWAIAYQQSTMLPLLLSMGFDANSVNESHLKNEIPEALQANNPLLAAFNAYLELKALNRQALLDYSVILPVYGEILLNIMWDWSDQTSDGFFIYSRANFSILEPQLAKLLPHYPAIQETNPHLALFIKSVFQSLVIRIEVSQTATELKANRIYATMREIAAVNADTLRQIEAAVTYAKPCSRELATSAPAHA